jgi:hypothetical protein
MGEHCGYGRVMPVHNLCDYFRESIDTVIAEQGVALDPHATHYVVNMMTLFSRSEQLYEDDGEIYGIRPLALMLAGAADAPSPEHRNLLLQRIGDVALSFLDSSSKASQTRRLISITTSTWVKTPMARYRRKRAALFAATPSPTFTANSPSSFRF